MLLCLFFLSANRIRRENREIRHNLYLTQGVLEWHFVSFLEHFKFSLFLTQELIYSFVNIHLSTGVEFFHVVPLWKGMIFGCKSGAAPGISEDECSVQNKNLSF